MIEKIVLDYLTEHLNVSVYMEYPQNEPSSFVLIEKTGGSETDHLKRATMAIQSYAGSMYDAALLNESIKTALSNIIELDSISKCSLNSDYNYTDTETKRYRYQAVFDFIYY